MVKTGFSVIPLRWLKIVIGPVILHSDFIFYFLPKGVRNWVADWILILTFSEEVKCIGLSNFSNIRHKFFPRFLRSTCMWIRMLIVIRCGGLSSCSPELRIPRRFLFCWLQLFHWSSPFSCAAFATVQMVYCHAKVAKAFPVYIRISNPSKYTKNKAWQFVW